MEPTEKVATSAREQRDWIDRVDALLARAEELTGAARANDAPLADRIGLWVEIIAVRRRLAAERAALRNEAVK